MQPAGSYTLEWSSAMSYQKSAHQPTRARNRAGCPYLNQTGADAVLDWANVLAGIDPAALPSEIQTELRRLQLKSGAAHSSASSR
jgi:hypothetical protein